MTEQKRKVGRPRRTTPAPERRVLSIAKTDLFVALLGNAHIAYRKAFGRDGTDAAVIRWALDNVRFIR